MRILHTCGTREIIRLSQAEWVGCWNTDFRYLQLFNYCMQFLVLLVFVVFCHVNDLMYGNFVIIRHINMGFCCFCFVFSESSYISSLQPYLKLILDQGWHTTTHSASIGHIMWPTHTKQTSSSWKQKMSMSKVPGPIASDFSQTFRDFGIRRKIVFFVITRGEFYSWKMYRLEDNENVTSYGNHN